MVMQVSRVKPVSFLSVRNGIKQAIQPTYLACILTTGPNLIL